MDLDVISRPLIGITTSEVRGPDEFKPKPQGDPPRKDLALGYRYFEAVERAGGIPVILPPLDPPAIDPLLAGLDGLCLAGGPDIDPRSYGGPDHPALGPTEPEIDRFEMRVTRAALARRMPIFAICRGLQILNVALGGSLRMHLPDESGELLVHRRLGDDGPVATHEVRVDPDSRLGEVFGSEPVSVNSYHHQAVRRLGRGLRPVAHADDGVIEGLEMKGPGYVVAVQWHAECMEGSSHECLYEAFVDASRCAARYADFGGRAAA
jgi:putative glutamine amidotransferase